MNHDAIGNELPILDTERLTLRRLSPADLEDATTAFGAPAFWRQTGWFDTVSRFGVAGLLDYVEQQGAAGEWATWGITLKGKGREGRVIGYCGLADIASRHRRAELGYALAHAHWGQGYTPEAVRAVLAYGFAALGLNRIYATCLPENVASARVLEKVGMQREGVLREYVITDGQPSDRAIYALLRRDWPAG